MTDIPKLMQLKYAVQSIRQRTITELNAIEALIDQALPKDIPDGPRPPGNREARKKYYREHGVGTRSHARKVSTRCKQ